MREIIDDMRPLPLVIYDLCPNDEGTQFHKTPTLHANSFSVHGVYTVEASINVGVFMITYSLMDLLLCTP